VACEQLKIPYILMEKEEEYCDIIKARCAAANREVAQPSKAAVKQQTNTLLNLSPTDIQEE
jgi:DNA modification methylase